MEPTVRRIPKIAAAEVIIATLLVNVLGLALPIVLLQVYDRIIPRQALGTLVLLGLGLLIAVLFEFAARSARAAIMNWAGALYEHQLRIRAVRHVLVCDLAALERTSPGRNLELMAAIDRLRERRAGESALVFVDLPFIALYVLVIAWVSVPLACLVGAILALTYILGGIAARRLRRAVEARAGADGERGSFMIHTLESLEPIKSLGLEALITRRYESLVRNSSVAGYRVTVIGQTSNATNAVISSLATALVGTVGAIFVMDGVITVGALAACVMLSGRAIQPVVTLQSHLASSLQADDYERRYQQLLDMPTSQSGSIAAPTVERIALRAVSVVNSMGERILDRVNLDLRIGETITVAGSSGSGKTLLLSLMAGLVAPDQGSVLINGHDRRDLDIQSIRSQIAYLPQRAPMLCGSVIENLTCFNPTEHVEEAIDLSVRLGLDQFFAAKPDGLTAPVIGAGQSVLPNSIAQQVALVRGLIGRPRVILFDEANMGLDRVADAKLRAYLESQKTHAAIVLVTHRPSYQSLADRRYRLEDGRLVEEATPINIQERLA